MCDRVGLCKDGERRETTVCPYVLFPLLYTHVHVRF